MEGENVNQQVIIDQNEKNRVEFFMKEALALAKVALSEEEVPVGCVFVFKGSEIIGRGYNKTNINKNATHHAEMVAIEQILHHSSGRYTAEVFTQCELFVTVEPCIMCAAALLQIKIAKVYFGCFNERFGGCGSVLHVHKDPAFPGYPIEHGIFKEEAIQLLKDFYELENKSAPVPAAIKKKQKRLKKQNESTNNNDNNSNNNNDTDACNEQDTQSKTSETKEC
eukprot:CAMPEP_0168556084 /NCGR_PEP_ID=MMETSP0413-20121227/8688_1 /TAXON_ID=136452 /ORGANISM="Filamoeba nolandi, Strain NC-AS-23-1" /LENGTH=223 /DNA_ID=CAMNT_0008586995 /DNA_START=157 /DNA_END=828 /DNA_ORIENTATION=+